MSTDYSRLLRDPRWQRKRLEVLSSAEFKCQACGDENSPLHVHHSFYEKGSMPWEYDTPTLWALCESCHAEVELETMACKPIVMYEMALEIINGMRARNHVRKGF